MHNVLFTKELTKSQEALAHDYGLNIVEQPFIKVTLEYDTVTPPKADIWIVTSSNAARYLNAHIHEIENELYPEKIIAIGPATSIHLKNIGVPIEMPSYATGEKVVELVKTLQVNSAVFFSGNLRSNTIPEALQDEINFTEFQVYQTELLETIVNVDEFDAIAFFSPSGVRAFAKKNKITTQKVIAVGTVTKRAVQEHLGVRARIGATPSVEDVLFAVKEDLS